MRVKLLVITIIHDYLLPQTSEGVIEVNTEKNKEKTVQATLNIVNGKNIHVIGTIYGNSVNLFDTATLQKAVLGDQNVPKTVTVVYAHNTTQTRNRKIVLGNRQAGDKLIDFQTHNVTFSYRFPEVELQFHDKNKHITSVGFSFDVSAICHYSLFTNRNCFQFFISV